MMETERLLLRPWQESDAELELVRQCLPKQ